MFYLTFCIAESHIKETYQIERKKYLCCLIWKSGFSILDGSITHLLVPDDNSVLANSIRSIQINPEERKELFSIPFAELEFRPNFHQRISVLQVKNTD